MVTRVVEKWAKDKKYKENSLFFLERFSTFLSSDLSRKALKIKGVNRNGRIENIQNWSVRRYG